MPYKAQVIEVLIASPSDTEKYRKTIEGSILTWNRRHAKHHEVFLQPKKWEEDSLPEQGDRAQQLINKQLVDKCDLLIGVFWTKVGTDTGKAESGTIEEIERFIENDKPVMLYFSQEKVDMRNIDTDQFDRLEKAKVRFQNNGITADFDDDQKLKDLLETHITRVVSQKFGEYSKYSPKVEESAQNLPLNDFKMYTLQFKGDILRLEINWEAERDSGPMSINEGQQLIKELNEELVDLKLLIMNHGTDRILVKVNELIGLSKKLGKHLVYMDGGVSYRAFWDEGNRLFELTNALLSEIESDLD